MTIPETDRGASPRKPRHTRKNDRRKHRRFARRRYRQAEAEAILEAIVAGADRLGTDPAGNTWLLVSVHPRTMEDLAALGAEFADMEPDVDEEPDEDGEPSLGSSPTVNQRHWADGCNSSLILCTADREGDEQCDDEPSLGCLEASPAGFYGRIHNVDQTQSWRVDRTDREGGGDGEGDELDRGESDGLDHGEGDPCDEVEPRGGLPSLEPIDPADLAIISAARRRQKELPPISSQPMLIRSPLGEVMIGRKLVERPGERPQGDGAVGPDGEIILSDRARERIEALKREEAPVNDGGLIYRMEGRL